MEKFTVVLLNIDRSDSIVMHVKGVTARAAYEAALRELWEESVFDPTEDPFDPEIAESDRPLLAIFRGHLTNLAS